MIQAGGRHTNLEKDDTTNLNFVISIYIIMLQFLVYH